MLEFVAAAPWSVETRALAGALQELQDSLGSLNDAVVGDELMADVAQDAAVQRDIPLALFAAGVVAGDTVADPAPLMQRALKAAALIRKDSSFR
jgi:CHAD domain-containing protein